MDPTTAMISAAALSLRTRAGDVYRDVDLDVPAGTLTVVTGPARSGKTALLLTVAGRMKPGTGSLSIAGIDARRSPGRVRKVAGLGEFRGVNGLDDTISVADQVRAELALHGRSWRKAEIQRVLAPLDLELDHDADIGALSAADRLLLGAALGRIGEPPLLVLDELDENTTPEETAQVMATLRRLTGDGVTIFAGTLDPRLAQQADLSVSLPVGEPPTAAPPHSLSSSATHPDPSLEAHAHAFV